MSRRAFALTLLTAFLMATGRADAWNQAGSKSDGSLERTAVPDRLRPSGLHPGQFEVLTQQIPVRIVFVGYSREQVNLDDFQAFLPATYRPVVRYPQFYGLGRNLGLVFEFRYTFDFKESEFTNRFFGALASMGRPGPRTEVQTMYNDQVNNVLDVSDEVLYLDAPSVEAWLHKNDRGRNDQGYTIYFMNWYGRPDFRFHVYEKTDEPDPDTGYNFGALRPSRGMIAWGGSTGRLWFYDLSAGPEQWGGSWNVDDADIDGDGEDDGRLPPIWEYAEGGFLEYVGNDLGAVTRFIAINLLFTTSPLYDPLVTAPGAGGAKVAHVAMFEDDEDPTSTGLDFFDAKYMRARLQEFQPYYRWKVGESLTDPIDAGAKAALDTFETFWTGDYVPGCWEMFGLPLAELYCFLSANQASYFPAYRPNDYVGKVASFNTAALGEIGVSGLADDNWTDGTQSFMYAFNDPELRSIGYGFTNTTVHEFGHHVGLSHPHDGYDSEWSEYYGILFEYSAGGAFYFVWSGDESNTAMSYNRLSQGFGQFDRDNLYRWETAGYLNWSNALAEAVLAHPQSRRVQALVEAADRLAAHGRAQFQRWNYLESAAAMRRAYELVLKASDEIGASSPAIERARAPLPAPPPRHLCTVRFPRE
jgi:hypothetical protein